MPYHIFAHQIIEDVLSIKPGTLDDTSWLSPPPHYWTKRKRTWVQIAGAVPCFCDDR